MSGPVSLPREFTPEQVLPPRRKVPRPGGVHVLRPYRSRDWRGRAVVRRRVITVSLVYAGRDRAGVHWWVPTGPEIRPTDTLHVGRWPQDTMVSGFDRAGGFDPFPGSAWVERHYERLDERGGGVS